MILFLAAETRRTPAEIEAMPFRDMLAWHAELIKQEKARLGWEARLAGFQAKF